MTTKTKTMCSVLKSFLCYKRTMMRAGESILGRKTAKRIHLHNMMVRLWHVLFYPHFFPFACAVAVVASFFSVVFHFHSSTVSFVRSFAVCFLFRSFVRSFVRFSFVYFDIIYRFRCQTSS